MEGKDESRLGAQRGEERVRPERAVQEGGPTLRRAQDIRARQAVQLLPPLAQIWGRLGGWGAGADAGPAARRCAGEAERLLAWRAGWRKTVLLVSVYLRSPQVNWLVPARHVGRSRRCHAAELQERLLRCGAEGEWSGRCCVAMVACVVKCLLVTCCHLVYVPVRRAEQLWNSLEDICTRCQGALGTGGLIHHHCCSALLEVSIFVLSSMSMVCTIPDNIIYQDFIQK